VTTTNNGWPVVGESSVTRVHLADDPDGALVRSGDVAAALSWLVEQIHARVERVTKVNGWRSAAYNRQVGGARGSNHISGTALDVNGHLHPYEAGRLNASYGTGGWGEGGVRTVRAILAEADGLFAWGLDFTPGWRDAMHFDIAKGKTAADVAALVARIEEDDDMPLDPEQRIPVKGEAAKVLGTTKLTLGGMLGYAAADYRQNRRDNAKVLLQIADLKRTLGQPIDTKALAAEVVEQLADDLEDTVREAVAAGTDPSAIAVATVELLRKRLAS